MLPSDPSSTLVLLSLDEREALERLLPLIPDALFTRVVAVDGGSTDGTLELYSAAKIEVIVQKQRGRGAAFLQARDVVHTDFVVFFSVDGNEDPRDLPRILEMLRTGYDQVIAGRFVQRGSITDVSDDPLRLRKLGATAFGVLARCFFQTGVWDATNGYRGFRVDSFRKLELDATGHEIEYQATIRAAKLGMKTIELATHELPRLGGSRKATAGTFALGSATLACLVRELKIGHDFARSS